MICLVLIAGLSGCAERQETTESGDSPRSYKLTSVHPVSGRQGICTEGDYYWVSGSGSLTKYDKDWNVVAENTDPLSGYELEVNHIGDIAFFPMDYLGWV